ncbi:hypothetical protein SEA_SUPERCHUNK_79 [Mycobacterium phage Superchunk]|nr:hypothetical protein SEA_SUPERCHUNK_79 [Mycobacterium phage Superchunk]
MLYVDIDLDEYVKSYGFVGPLSARSDLKETARQVVEFELERAGFKAKVSLRRPA